MTARIFLGADVFDGHALHCGHGLLIEDGIVSALLAPGETPVGAEITRLDGGTILPGFVDLQVNGGGGILFNDVTTPEGIARIARAHAATGTRALLPTLITDRPEKTRAAIDAVTRAIAQGQPDILGLHLEGPHLAAARKGAHDAALIRPMGSEDLALLCDAAQRLPNLLVTVAPETVPPAQISTLSRAGVIVSLGHTDCTYEAAKAAFAAGARAVTHLFNAMSQLGSRAPGLVGAALDTPEVRAGIIADGHHVHPGTLRTAIAAKAPPGGLFVVTDAMATLGSEIDGFALNGRRVIRQGGRLTLEDGTLAGADADMPTACAVLTGPVGLPLHEALAMATSAPAALLRDARGFGEITPGEPSTAIHLDAAGRARALPSAPS
ncbi:N-acetylglucosamine-6-phosphate deacetylase [Poseidonocella sedimentorum]|uniref:N-acetylglucosamine 6-phosphate deacetylase n=1 Tax=Poseidonocella sedimentorum TaxID=871652 RepID=A0A1I6ER41_9RHOB|nr:N-acetylglucosamine-6-phosphate deacetylase [Poseidonocella sedimentorum]SFR20234.1 N-acetylglucosamine 6-phosphate deacetylase [Poseidonocella sedimentorum]